MYSDVEQSVTRAIGIGLLCIFSCTCLNYVISGYVNIDMHLPKEHLKTDNDCERWMSIFSM